MPPLLRLFKYVMVHQSRLLQRGNCRPQKVQFRHSIEFRRQGLNALVAALDLVHAVFNGDAPV